MRVAQVTARLGDTIVDVAHVAPGERYTIGTARDVRLAIAEVSESLLVSGEVRGFVVRRPVGLGTLEVGGRHCDEVVVANTPVTFELGLISVEIVVVELGPVPVPRPAVDRRTPVYVVASLIVHLLVWGSALTFGTLPRAKRPRPIKQSHPLIVRLAPEVPPAPTSPLEPRSEQPATAQPGVRARIATKRAAEDHLPVDRDGLADRGAAIAQLNEVTKDGYIGKMLDQVGPVYVPSAVDHPFGDAEKLDPNTRPGWGALSIVTGRYRTIDVHDPIPASQGLALCESRRCEVTGSLAKEDVQQTAATRGYDLERCVNRGAVMLELDIAPDGHVTKVHGEGKAARCAANVIATLAFPVADDATHATFTIGFP